jgi:GNAT superfamily N-acetyltransferase
MSPVTDSGIPIIRKATRDDAAAIARVHVDSWRTTYRDIVPEEHLAKLSYEERENLWKRAIADPRQFTYVAEEAGRIVGFANGGKNRGMESDYTGELYAVYLLQAHQQRGVGRRLTLAIATDLEKAGMRSMIVWVLKDNPACEFYRRLGGKPAASKMTIIGGTTLEEAAFGWSDVGPLLRPVST